MVQIYLYVILDLIQNLILDASVHRLKTADRLINKKTSEPIDPLVGMFEKNFTVQ